MNTHPQIEITLYDNRHSYKSERQKNAKWLQAAMPAIMQTQKMTIDVLYLGPLEQVVALCLS